jgi:penicillin-binding protein 1A
MYGKIERAKNKVEVEMEKKKKTLVSSMPVFSKRADKPKTAKSTKTPKVSKILNSHKEDEFEKEERKSLKAEKRAKAPKKALFKKKNNKMGIYSSLSYRHKAKKEAQARKEAEELAKMPKNPVLRFFAHLHPKRVFKFIFSLRGLFFFFKCVAAVILLGIIALGGLFLYYKKDLESIRLDEMKVSESVNVYLDRNGEVLWEDRGDGDYRLVVDADAIPEVMRNATVAIEDRNFYNHNGIDISGIVRAAWSTLTHQGVQGGSTLTQQLIKQVYFADEAASENRGGLARKIKEMILAIEVEKMYSKDQIITMYLNESPYGGRRNGVESAAQAYFGKTAKDLTLAEAALLASIPNNPAVLNPYNTAGNEALVARQQKTLDVMCEMGYISEQERDEAKAINILDTIRPETGQYDNIKAPHFVLEVKKQLEEKYGMKTMRAGGFVIKTTIDLRAQKIAEEAVATGAGMTRQNGSDNIALSSVDVETGQVLAMVGSIDWNKPGYGELNATTSLLEPGSSIKPVLDYGPLFMQRDGQNYGPGTILKDENIDRIYCGGNSGACRLRNYSGRFYGNITIRKSLANSLNIGAVKALYINGIENSLDILHKLGDISYCADRDPTQYGLSIAIGSGCGVRGIEHANTYASIARGGVYKPLSYILEVKNSSGDVIEQWEDTEGERVYDEQVAYMIEDILGDAQARTMMFGSMSYSFGFTVPGVWTGTKTGTTTTSNSAVTKDSWIASFSTAIATTVWNGKHDGSGLLNSSNDIVRRVVNNYMEKVHKDVYAKEGKWHSGDKPVRPKGIQNLKVNGQSDIWPSWYNSKTSGTTKEKITFNRVTKKVARDCTPESLRETIEVTVMTDPVSKNKVYSGIPDGYNREATDPCNYQGPTVAVSNFSGGKLAFGAVKGTANLNAYIIYVNEKQVATGSLSSAASTEGDGYVVDVEAATGDTIRVQITDVNGESASDSLTVQ